MYVRVENENEGKKKKLREKRTRVKGEEGKDLGNSRCCWCQIAGAKR